MGWNKKHKETWHPKGSKCSEGGSYAKWLVVDCTGRAVKKYVRESQALAARDEFNSDHKYPSEFDLYKPYAVKAL